MKSDPLIISTGAGESPTDLASLLVPMATTSSTSSAAATKEGIEGISTSERAIANPLILVLNILFTPKFINNCFKLILESRKRDEDYSPF